MAKPTGNVVLDTGNALIRNPIICVPYTEGSGTARDIVTGRGATVTWTSNAAGNCAGITLQSSQPVGSVIGIDGQDGLSIPTGVCTIAFVRRKTDTTLRFLDTITVANEFDPHNTITPSNIRCIPGYADGNSYFFYGGSAVTWGGYTPSTNVEAWVFVAGATTQALYKDSGTAVATAASAAARVSPVPLSWPTLLLNVRGDLQEINFFMILGTEWSSAEVATWIADPYAFLTAGTPPVTGIQLPTLPRATVSPYPYVTPGADGATTQLGGIYRVVHSGDDLQAKLNLMRTGDVMVIDAGASFAAATYRLPSASTTGNTLTTGWCAILSSNDALLPGGAVPGQRVEPIDSPNMPRVMTNSVGPSIFVTGPAETDGTGAAGPSHGWIIRGIEMGPDGTFPADPTAVSICGVSINATYFGNNSGDANSHRIIIDRCLCRSHYANVNQNKLDTGISCQGEDVQILGCYITDLQDDGQDTSAIFIDSTRGNILIENNFLAGTAGGVFCGGSFPPNAVSTALNVRGQAYLGNDVVVRKNYITKLPRWQGNSSIIPEGWINSPYWNGTTDWNVKSTLEIKQGLRWLIEANTFDNVFSWPAVTIDSWNQPVTNDAGANGESDAAWASSNMCADITIRYNRSRRNSSCGFQVAVNGNRSIKRVHLHNNLFFCLRGQPGGRVSGINPTGGLVGRIQGGGVSGPYNDLTDVLMEHNTTVSDHGAVSFGGSTEGPTYRIYSRNNIMGYGYVGFVQEGANPANSDAELTPYQADRTYAANALVDMGVDGFSGGTGSRSPVYTANEWGPVGGCAAGQYFITDVSATCGFNEYTGRLLPGSTLKAGQSFGASDNTDNGVDWRWITNPATRWPTATTRPTTTSRPAATLIPQGT